jgi:dCMP deaminase
MPKQILLDNAYLEMAKIWSQLSKADRKKVGCIIVKDGSIISDGYNGTPIGFDNACEIELNINDCSVLKTKPEVLHAESNAITKLAKSTHSSKDSTMYITIAPCIDCAKLIIQSGIKRVVYKNNYKNLNGVNLLLKANIIVDCHEDKKVDMYKFTNQTT